MNSEAVLISPKPLPLSAASLTEYVVSGFRPMMVTVPSLLAVERKRGNVIEDGKSVGESVGNNRAGP